MQWSPGPIDVVRVLDAVYAFDVRDHHAWLEGLDIALEPSLAGARKVLLSIHRARPAGRELIALVPRLDEAAMAGATTDAFTRAVAATPPVSFASDTIRRSTIGALPALVHSGVVEAMPEDLFHVWSAGSDGVCLSIAALLAQRGAPLLPAERKRWTQLTAHLGAAARLRVRGLPVPEAVLTPDGKVLDATGPAQTAAAREALQLAARAVDRVRSRKITDAEEALAVWRVLTDGRWTIADQHDTDGRRFVVAWENVPTPRQIVEPCLSARERQVACLAALGHSNKHIGGELALAPSTVATHLKHAILKLGTRTRAELARRLLEGPPTSIT